MRTLLIMLLSLAVGWLTHEATIEAMERIYDWRKPALFALVGVALIVLIAILP